MWPFKPTPEKLINKLAKLEDRVQKVASQVDEFENRNPMIGALGNAFGGIGIGTSRNPQFAAKMAELNQKKKQLDTACRKKRTTVQNLKRLTAQEYETLPEWKSWLEKQAEYVP
jgi:prefoldin subunit 5